MASNTEGNSYRAILERIFLAKYRAGMEVVEFERDEIVVAAKALGLEQPKNLGDVIYSARYRAGLADSIVSTQPEGREWVIEGAGRGKYAFRLESVSRILPNAAMAVVGIPDNTPELIRLYKLDDEQALLAVVRYNRLVDIFLGLTAFSLQNHLRSSVAGLGQIEIDELYVGIDKAGCHFAIPVQAKGGADQISAVQTKQDIAWCAERFPGMRVRALSAQFMGDSRVAMFELGLQDSKLRVFDEKHYKLVEATDIDRAAIVAYRD